MSSSENSTDEAWRDLYQEIMDRRAELTKWNNLHVKVYKYLGYLLGLSMPLLAALVTYLSTASNQVSLLLTSIIGLLLTFLTVLNAVLTPGERFLSAVQLSHDLKEFGLDVTMELRKLSAREPRNIDEIYALLRTRNRQLSIIGEAMARGTLSTSAPERKEHEQGSEGKPGTT